MRIQSVVEFLKTMPYSNESQGGKQLMFRCPFCGDSKKNQTSTHFSIKIDVAENEPMVYQCFQPICSAKGILTTEVLQKIGCRDLKVILDLSKHNSTISKKLDKFKYKQKKNYAIVNLNNDFNKKKLEYINGRLGTKFEPKDLTKLKIQLSLYDYLTINSIKKLFFKQKYCDMINLYTIGFISTYEDYLIFRDVSKDKVMNRRYINYRIAGDYDDNDTKIYTIPTDIDLITDEPSVINLAEGPFSILGAYLYSKIDRNYINQIFTANCGMGYFTTVSHFCKQYGLTNIILNIYSDSEIKVNEYNKLYDALKSNVNIKEMKIHYNTMQEDFGYSKDNIKINTITIK